MGESLDGIREFKARLEFQDSNVHAIEMWFRADNIAEAVAHIIHKFAPIGFQPSDLVSLVEIDKKRGSLPAIAVAGKSSRTD